MDKLSPTELLHVWEEGQGRSPIQQALLLLAAVCSEVAVDELAAFRIGRRDGILLQLQEELFGSQIVSLASCPECGERVELTFNVADIRMQPNDLEENSVLPMVVGEYELIARPLNSLDLVAMTRETDRVLMQQALLARCLLSIRRGAVEHAASDLPEAVITAIAEQIAQADPQADVRFALSCPGCTHQWQAIFDIVTYLWSEVDVWARRLLRQIHVLAQAYGWREADILALSPRRRAYYLELVEG
jgi:hypothetical protein